MRLADAQTTVGEVAALAALIQSLVRLEATAPLADEVLLDAPEVLAENRFLASRDGVSARLIDPVEEARVAELARVPGGGAGAGGAARSGRGCLTV